MQQANVIHYDWHNKPQKGVILGGRTFDFKSLIEYRYAQYLQKKLELGVIEEWDYEPTTFEMKERYRRRRIYTPDFWTAEIEFGLRVERYYEVKTALRQKDVMRFKYLRADHPKVLIVLVLPSCSRSTNQSRLRGNALKYVEYIQYCNPLFKQFGIT